MKLAAPFCQCLRSPAISYLAIRSEVAHLRALQRPSAIPSLIVTVGIDSVDGVRSRRPWSHVLKEQSERGPTLTDLNSTTAVRTVLRCFWIEASASHSRPRCISQPVSFADRQSVRDVLRYLLWCWMLKASARPHAIV